MGGRPQKMRWLNLAFSMERDGNLVPDDYQLVER